VAVILDTNALSAWLDGDRAIERHLEIADRIALSPIALGEFRFGVLTSRYREKYEQRLRSIEQEFPPLSITGITAAHYAMLRRQLVLRGRPIPWHDLWIAAQARQHHLPVLSRDEHFDMVPDVRRISW
jgi:tRNA(fMet)-specific endonuclease VapC